MDNYKKNKKTRKRSSAAAKTARKWTNHVLQNRTFLFTTNISFLLAFWTVKRQILPDELCPEVNKAHIHRFPQPATAHLPAGSC